MLHKEMYQCIADAAMKLSVETCNLRHTFGIEAEHTLFEMLLAADMLLGIAENYCRDKAREE